MLPFDGRRSSIHLIGEILRLLRLGGVGAGAIVSSLDGSEWTLQSPSLVSALTSVIYGSSRFLAVGQAGQVEGRLDNAKI